jgi:hypothetical protein
LGDGRWEALGMDIGPSLARSYSSRMTNGPYGGRHISLETIAPLSDDSIVKLPALL